MLMSLDLDPPCMLLYWIVSSFLQDFYKVIFFKQYICGYCDAVGYSSDRFYPCFVIVIVYTHSLYLIAEDKMSYGHLRCYFDQGAQNALDNSACLIL